MHSPTDQKKRYDRPVLVVYGSVRNLTGGSIGKCNDQGSITNPNEIYNDGGNVCGA
jgi:hypothetical protein